MSRKIEWIIEILAYPKMGFPLKSINRHKLAPRRVKMKKTKFLRIFKSPHWKVSIKMIAQMCFRSYKQLAQDLLVHLILSFFIILLLQYQLLLSLSSLSQLLFYRSFNIYISNTDFYLTLPITLYYYFSLF